MKGSLGNNLDLGRIADQEGRLMLSAADRAKHLYVVGGTGVGKSRYLEHLIRQDIDNWRRSKSGLLLLDPHGSLYDGIMAWVARYQIKAPIIPIDLRQNDWIVGYNPLRQREGIDPAVIVEELTNALAHVWGESDTQSTPRFNRRAQGLLYALYQVGLTLAEAPVFLDYAAKELRRRLASEIPDSATRLEWESLNGMSAKEFEAELGSTINRFQPFARNKTMRAIFGQQNSLDLGQALDEGHIILVSLGTANSHVSEENARVFATLLLADLWRSARNRGKPRGGVKPFYLYIDEFQEFITPTIAKGLDQARGFGLHLTLAHQFPEQLLDAGPHGKAVYNSVMANASSKIVFRVTHPESLDTLAKWMFMGSMDTKRVKHTLWSTKVLDYEMITLRGSSSGESEGSGSSSQAGSSLGESQSVDPDGMDVLSTGESFGESSGSGESWYTSSSSSESEHEALKPVLGQEISQIQYEPIEEQQFRAAQGLFLQEDRQAAIRIGAMPMPVSVRTPTVEDVVIRPEQVMGFRDRALSAAPAMQSALPMMEAVRMLNERQDRFLATPANDEPITARRRVPKP